MKRLFSLMLAATLCLGLVPRALAQDSASPYLLKAVSDDWIDFQFELNNQAYQLPLPVSIFLDQGWILSDPNITLNPNQYTLSQELKKDDMILRVQLLNMGIDVLPANQCLIGQINAEAKGIESSGLVFSIAEGVTFGTPQAQVEEQYGSPKSTYTGTYYEKATYATETYSTIDVYYDIDSKLVNQIEIQNFITPEGYNDEAIAAEVTVPEEVANYMPAKALGEDLFAFNVSINGTVYTLPGAYKYFEEQGWRLGDKTKDKLAAKDSKGRIALLYDKGHNMNVRFVNPTDTANILENCFVASLVFDEDFPGEVLLPGGITLGMTQADLDKALEGLGLSEEALKIEEHTSSIEYTLRKKVMREVTLYVKPDTKVIYKIEIMNTTSNLTGSEE